MMQPAPHDPFTEFIASDAFDLSRLGETAPVIFHERIEPLPHPSSSAAPQSALALVATQDAPPLLSSMRILAVPLLDQTLVERFFGWCRRVWAVLWFD